MEHEAPNGKYANGIITKNYMPGSEISVTVLITANHKVDRAINNPKSLNISIFKGFFMFRLCKNNNIHQDPDQACFESSQSLLRLSSGGDR